MSDAYVPPEQSVLARVRAQRAAARAKALREKLKETTQPEETPAVSSYHDVFVTTPDIGRTSIFNLPYGYELHCTRVTGWQLWFNGDGVIPEPTMVAGEYEGDGKWLVVDVAGHVIVDSRPAVLSPEETQPVKDER